MLLAILPSWLLPLLVIILATGAVIKFAPLGIAKGTPDPDAPVSVNFFPSRKCNYTCGFCFHTDTSSFVLDVDEMKRGLRLLRDAGMRKLNIAGGEPFLYPHLLTKLLRFCKEELHLESVSIISNGSKITEKWMRHNSQWLDILAVSCDSFDAATNRKIGRGDDGANVERLFRVAAWCRECGVKFKLNTVVNVHNWDEDMSEAIARLAPFRWKVFQCLIVAGENENATRKRDATQFLVSEEQWRTFCARHRHLPCYVPEDNSTMAGSYLLVDEYMRFMDKGAGMMTTSQSILDVGVRRAMQQVTWDREAFRERGGVYDGSKEGAEKEKRRKELEW